ncbi:Signal recognition particle subunit SRP72 [Plasmodiophora brassicae]|uniref:Signal recognition particle subunit SRP72 n=1 Tax=Plasmodiophora brassicae TaxID=37360 RepID=A0A0G4IRU9_PLABS|nr:hypothetical protein PBRA_005940 [Plasmodiophora brassicae]SPQ98376.1 unnamed protein product [Plasmodiophora brassicae]
MEVSSWKSETCRVSMASSAVPASLWTSLRVATQSEDHEKVLKDCKAILAHAADDARALHCRLVALLQLDRLADAQAALWNDAGAFERAYLLFRLKNNDAASAALESCSERRADYLRALLAARLSKSDDAAAIYRRLLSDPDLDEDDRVSLQTNLTAVCAVAEGRQVLNDVPVESRTHSLLYNVACLEINAGEYASAEAHLVEAIRLCTDEDDDLDVDELATLTVQLAYARQLQGKTAEAQELYHNALESLPPTVHSPASAVASLNLMSLRQHDEKHFDSAKRLARALKVDAAKLTEQQRRTIARNQALLMLYDKQLRACVERCDAIGADDEFACVVRALALVRDGHADEAIGSLRRFTPGTRSVRLALIQVLVDTKQYDQALRALDDPVFDELRNRVAFTSLLIVLHDALGDVAGALKVFEGVVEKRDGTAEDRRRLVVAAADYMVRHGKIDAAQELLSRAGALFPNDTALAGKVALAFSAAGVQPPDAITKRLPQLPTLSEEALAAVEAKLQYVPAAKRKSSPPDASVAADAPAAKPAEEKVKAKKKKKKPIRYPKGFDPAHPGPPPDPERWIPRYERTKGRRRHQGGAFKGAQGSVAASTSAGSGRSRAQRGEEDKNVIDNRRQKEKQMQGQASTPSSKSNKKGKKRR